MHLHTARIVSAVQKCIGWVRGRMQHPRDVVWQLCIVRMYAFFPL